MNSGVESDVNTMEDALNGNSIDVPKPSVKKKASISSTANAVLTADTVVSSDIFKSVVKLFVVRCAPNYSRPWQMTSQTHSTSTGFIISNNRILCNAHGVTYSRSIRIRKHGDSKKYDAKLEHIGHECDLAILSVSSKKFWKGLIALNFDNKTPKLQDIVVVVGYPIGGDNICVTKGVVSRVGFVNYSHALESLFSIQIDAAINPGNSGGPTIMNNKVVGVAFETHLGAQNIGYCIPMRVVQHFLNDIKIHKKYTKFPKLGFRWQKIENPSLKKYFHMMLNKATDDDNKTKSNDNDDKDNNADNDNDSDSDKDDDDDDDDDDNKDSSEYHSGILVNSVYPLTDCCNKLRENDVVLSIDNILLGEDGTIPYEYPEDGVARINYNYIISSKYCGDVAELDVLRDGVIIRVSVYVNIIDYLVPIVLYDRPVTYYIFGGIVFVPLSRPYLQSQYGSKWSSKCPVKLKDLYFNGYKKEKNEEIIILSKVLASEENVGYHKFQNRILEKCNNIDIKNMNQLTEIIDNSIQNKNQFVKFVLEHNITIVLEINTAMKSMTKIKKQHRIEYDRSENLRKLQKTNQQIDNDDDKSNDNQDDKKGKQVDVTAKNDDDLNTVIKNDDDKKGKQIRKDPNDKNKNNKNQKQKPKVDDVTQLPQID